MRFTLKSNVVTTNKLRGTGKNGIPNDYYTAYLYMIYIYNYFTNPKLITHCLSITLNNK